MLNIRIICVGKFKEKYWEAASAEYMKRLGAYCSISVVEVKEEKLPAHASRADEENVIVNDCFHLKIYDHNGNFIRKSADLNKPDYLQHLYIHKTGDGNFLFKGEDPDNTSDYVCIVDADGNTIAQTLILNYSASEVENFKSRSL